MVISLILFCLAPSCNACMDVLQFHWDTSIFKYYPRLFNPQWWNPSISWINKYKNKKVDNGEVKWLWGLISKPVMLTDAWHFFKSLMILFIILAIVIFSYASYTSGIFYIKTWQENIFFILLLILTWIQTFNLFYNHILKK